MATKRAYRLCADVTMQFTCKLDRVVEILSPAIEFAARELQRGQPVARLVEQLVARFPAATRFFDLDVTRDDEFGLKSEYLFPRDNPSIAWTLRNGHGRLSSTALGTEVTESDVAGFLENLGTSPCRDVEEHPVGSMLLRSGAITTDRRREHGALQRAGPGTIRLQHAGLLVATGRAKLLVDPHIRSLCEPEDLRSNFSCRDLLDGLTVVLISHGHLDHFSATSLAMIPRNTPIVVPRVPRASLLCEDLVAHMRYLGFTTIHAPEWYAPPLRFDDLEVHVLPFFGEQPLVREFVRHPDLRNWGNTYAIRTPRETMWILVDSGNDALGAMRDVAKLVRARVGPVDAILSNLRPIQMGAPLAITGGSYWLSLSVEQMRRFESTTRDVITLGPDGVAEICAAANARFFLPYAHWWSPLGTSPDDGGLLLRLAASLRSRAAATTIVDWSIGDCFSPTAHGFSLRPLGR